MAFADWRPSPLSHRHLKGMRRQRAIWPSSSSGSAEAQCRRDLAPLGNSHTTVSASGPMVEATGAMSGPPLDEGPVSELELLGTRGEFASGASVVAAPHRGPLTSDNKVPHDERCRKAWSALAS